MNNGTWKSLEDMFETFPMMKAGPVSDLEIDSAEQNLGVLFGQDYRGFIARYGGALVGPYPIFGLKKAVPMSKNDFSVIEVTNRFRNAGWPGVEQWIVISMDHSGNPIGIGGDGRVRISDHDNGGIAIIADSFEDFLKKWCLK